MRKVSQQIGTDTAAAMRLPVYSRRVVTHSRAQLTYRRLAGRTRRLTPFVTASTMSYLYAKGPLVLVYGVPSFSHTEHGFAFQNVQIRSPWS